MKNHHTIWLFEQGSLFIVCSVYERSGPPFQKHCLIFLN